MQGHRRVSIGIKIRPIQRHQDSLPLTNDVRHPVANIRPHVNPWIAQQPVDLFDRMLPHEPARLRQSMPIAWIAKAALLITPKVAFASEDTRLA